MVCGSEIIRMWSETKKLQQRFSRGTASTWGGSASLCGFPTIPGDRGTRFEQQTVNPLCESVGGVERVRKNFQSFKAWEDFSSSLRNF